MLKKFGKTLFLFFFVFAFIFLQNTGLHPLQFVTESFGLSKDWLPFQDSNKPERLNRVLYLISENYVDPERVNYSLMFENSLDLLSSNVTKLSVTRTEKKTTINIDKKKKEFPTKIDTVFTLRNNLSDAVKFVAENTQGETKPDQLEEIAIEGVLDTLDPHSNFLSEQMYREMQVGTTGKFGGLGIVIGIRDAKLTVISPIDDTPASKAGIMSGDAIIKIDDQITAGMPLNEAVDLMRGDKGAPVTITIERKGWEKAKDFHLIRDIIRVASVDAAILPNDIGYIKLKSFQEDTTSQLKKGLSAITAQTQQGLKGLILDLRNDPGGLLDQAISVSDLFLEQGTIVTTVGLRNKMRESRDAEVKNTQPMYPMVVLVNQGSASASEIVAGALQRNQRAIVVGQKTFGKGTVQTLYELPEKSALKLTVAKYLTPGDISIQSIGIGPEVQTVPVVIDKEQTTFFYSDEESGEAELERHFTNDQKPLNMTPVESVQYLFQKKKADERTEGEYSFSKMSVANKQARLLADFDVKICHDILINAAGNSKEQLLVASKKAVEMDSKQEDQEIAAAMLKQGIDWTLPTASPKKSENCKEPQVSYEVIPPANQKEIHMGDKIELQFTMKNTSNCTLYRSSATSKSDSGFFNHTEVFFGKLMPQQVVTRKIPLTIPSYQPVGLYDMSFKFDQINGAAPKPQNVTIAILPNKHPIFAFDYEIDDQIQNQNGFLAPHTPERGEKFYLKLKVKNIGDITSKESYVSIKQEGTKSLQFQNAREKLTNLLPNGEAEVKFLIDVPQQLNEPSFELYVSVSDVDFQSYIQKKIKMNIFQAKVAESKPSTPTAHYFEEPTIQISNLAKLMTKQGSTVTIEGIVKDDIAIQDMYIMVNGKKAIYHPFQDSAKSQNFSLTIPLKKGKNDVYVVARDNEDLIQSFPLNILSQ